MNKIDDGGRAFPRTVFYLPHTPSDHEVMEATEQQATQDGLTLRDYHAAAALTGLLARKVTAPAADLAGQAYELADALIAGRTRPATSERENLLGVIADLTTEASTAASVMTDDQLRAVLVLISRSGNDAIRDARGM